MRTTERTRKLFRASLGDDDLGYPSEVEFVPADEEWSDDVVRRNLAEGRAIVLVGDAGELLIIPYRRNPLDRMRGSVRVRVTQRVDGRPGQFVTPSRLGRHPVRQVLGDRPSLTGPPSSGTPAVGF
jgi:hypothetical protein